MSAEGPDVAVVGGGLIGLCSALALQRSGASTLLVNAGRMEDAASYGAAGHIATEQVEPLANPAAVRGALRRLYAFGGPLDFRVRDAATWGGWAVRYLLNSRAGKASAGMAVLAGLLRGAPPAWRRLTSELARPDLLIEAGHLVVWESGRTAREGRERWNRGPTGEAKVRELSRGELAAMGRALKGPVVDGIGFEGTAQIASPAGVLAAVGEAFERSGGRRLESAARLVVGKDGRAGLQAAARTIRPGLLVVAAGVGSGPLLKACGHVAPIVAERGYHIEADADDWPRSLPPVVFEDRSMIVTRFGDRIRAASFVEFGRPDAPPDRRKWARLESHAAALGVPMRGARSRWAGSRPTLPDYLPAIGRSHRAENLIYAFGHQHLGLTLAPLTAELVADLASGRTPAIPLEPLDLARFDGTRKGERR